MKTENKYISSITTKYGDVENVKADCKILNEILARQGTSLLIDVIAEHIGDTVIKFNLNSVESKRILESNVNELKEAILERI